jgi:hypothetical protein
MLWFSIWFLVILKIPAAYLAYVIWWAVKDPPAPSSGPALGGAESGNGGGGTPGPARLRLPRRPFPGRRGGPHGRPARRPVPAHVRERVISR